MPRTKVNREDEIGIVKPFAGNVAPIGYRFCDGFNLSRTTYAKLFAVIGTSWGNGDGSTTFHIPDLRGRFLRGRDAGAGRDPNAATRAASNTGGSSGDNVGSVQGQATRKNGLSAGSNTVGNHSHFTAYPQDSSAYYGNSTIRPMKTILRVDSGAYSLSAASFNATANQFPTNQVGNHAHSITVNNGDSETRALNANVNYIIRVN